MWLKGEEEEGEDDNLKGSFVFCMQVEHTGTRTYYFSTDSHAEQEEWIRTMSDAASVNNLPVNRCSLTCMDAPKIFTTIFCCFFIQTQLIVQTFQCCTSLQFITSS